MPQNSLEEILQNISELDDTDEGLSEIEILQIPILTARFESQLCQKIIEGKIRTKEKTLYSNNIPM